MKFRSSMKKYLLILVSSPLLLAACTSVKPYQKTLLNDSEMQLTSRRVEKTEMSFQSYREASSGANGGKTGGGCGCN
jgi:hypothetical protein